MSQSIFLAKGMSLALGCELTSMSVSWCAARTAHRGVHTRCSIGPPRHRSALTPRRRALLVRASSGAGKKMMVALPLVVPGKPYTTHDNDTPPPRLSVLDALRTLPLEHRVGFFVVTAAGVCVNLGVSAIGPILPSFAEGSLGLGAVGLLTSRRLGLLCPFRVREREREREREAEREKERERTRFCVVSWVFLIILSRVRV